MGGAGEDESAVSFLTFLNSASLSGSAKAAHTGIAGLSPRHHLAGSLMPLPLVSHQLRDRGGRGPC